MHRHNNRLKTFLLFTLMFGVLLGLGWIISYSTGNWFWIAIFGAFSLISIGYSYWNSDKLAIRSMQAYPVSDAEQPEMYRIITELSQRAGQPMPKLYVAPTHSPNAFATGRDPQHAAVCCTEGILHLLNERELRGVLAHELMHVYNRDILTSSLAAAIASVITSASQMLFFFGGGGRNRNSGGIGIIAGLLAMLLAPLAATLVQMGISRTREYDADQDGATLAQDPLALASALHKLEQGVNAAPLNSENQKVVNAAHMMIANPFGGKARAWFSTHPPMADRIQRLQRMAQEMGQQH